MGVAFSFFFFFGARAQAFGKTQFGTFIEAHAPGTSH
jgi:hypothetical protein